MATFFLPATWIAHAYAAQLGAQRPSLAAPQAGGKAPGKPGELPAAVEQTASPLEALAAHAGDGWATPTALARGLLPRVGVEVLAAAALLPLAASAIVGSRWGADLAGQAARWGSLGLVCWTVAAGAHHVALAEGRGARPPRPAARLLGLLGACLRALPWGVFQVLATTAVALGAHALGQATLGVEAAFLAWLVAIGVGHAGGVLVLTRRALRPEEPAARAWLAAHGDMARGMGLRIVQLIGVDLLAFVSVMGLFLGLGTLASALPRALVLVGWNLAPAVPLALVGFATMVLTLSYASRLAQQALASGDTEALPPATGEAP
jgi:hypothetical protein